MRQKYELVNWTNFVSGGGCAPQTNTTVDTATGTEVLQLNLELPLLRGRVYLAHTSS
jgi:hypothetical protein